MKVFGQRNRGWTGPFPDSDVNGANRVDKCFY
jgi:hypothetical protein